ncbi:MAG: hypothetical protein OEU92_07660 [Alphaproteobacteria bacterium]|nr:hypothetical protein [Alphaproteobacteria bacterium]
MHDQGNRRLIGKDDLRRAVDAGVIDAEQGDALWRFLAPAAQPETSTPRLSVMHVLWYGGTLIIIAAMGLFSSTAFAEWGGGALSITAIVYAAVFIFFARVLRERDLWLPGGLCMTIAVTMAPLFVFGVQDALGWWHQGDPGNYKDFYHWIKGSWLPMEIATIAAGLVAMAFYRFPFLVAPIAVALWFMSMDLVPWFFGVDWNSFDQRRIVSIWFGLAMLVVAWVVDMRARQDHAFWLHLFGLLAFWGGLNISESDSHFEKAIYCLINVLLLAAALFLQRRLYAVCGAIGIAFYLGDLAASVFKDALLYPFALSLIGLLIFTAGLLYHRHQTAIEAWTNRCIPPWLDALRPYHVRARAGGE